jgi:hypothetical protein
MTRARKPIRPGPALRLARREVAEQNALDRLVDMLPGDAAHDGGATTDVLMRSVKESFIARETAALQEIRAQLPLGKTVRESFSEVQVAQIFRKHGFANEEDYQLQHYLAFPPERRQ